MKNIILIFLLFDFSKEKELDFVKGTYNSPGIYDSVQMATSLSDWKEPAILTGNTFYN